jgi:hypothetical protein
MIKHRHYPVILFALVCMAWAACTQERQPCLTPKQATLIIQSIHFKSDTATIPVDSLLPHAVFAPVTSASNVATIYTTPASLFSISLSPNSSVCQWEIETDTATHAYDTLTFYYKQNLKFISNACSYTYFYNIDSVHTTHTFIDSVHIINPGVTNVTKDIKHVQIYIRRNF